MSKEKSAPRTRLDVALVERGLCDTREKARAVIMSGRVYIGEVKADKPSLPVAPGDAIEVRGAPHPYASRGGLKLERALDAFQPRVRDAVALDIGASTGGFTDCLLQRGASHVYAVDVGYGQLDYRLRIDPRVTVMERTNARYLTPDMLGGARVDLCAIDVSFISLRLILPAARLCLKDGGEAIALVKPQFEAGRDRVGKKGVVRDPRTHVDVLASAIACATSLGLFVHGLDISPIKGPEGNIEFLLYMQNGLQNDAPIDPEIIVSQAHARQW